MNKKILLSLLFPLLTSCPKAELPDEILQLVNNSPEPIVYWYDLTQYISNDTIFWYGEDLFNSYKIDKYTIHPEDTLKIGFYSDILEHELELGKIVFYFFDLDTVQNNSWQYIGENYLILKRKTFSSIEDFEDINWTLTYP